MAGFASRLKRSYGDTKLDQFAGDVAALIDNLAQKVGTSGKTVNDTRDAPDLTLMGNQGATTARRGQDGGLKNSLQLIRPLKGEADAEGGVAARETIREEMDAMAFPGVVVTVSPLTMFPLIGPVRTVEDPTGLAGVTSMQALAAAVMTSPSAYAGQAVSPTIIGDSTPALSVGECVPNLFRYRTYKVVAHFRKQDGIEADQMAVKTLIRTEWLLLRHCCGQTPEVPDDGGGFPPPPPG